MVPSTSGLSHRTFYAITPVRIRAGLLIFLIYINWLDSRSDKAEVPDSSSGVRTKIQLCDKLVRLVLYMSVERLVLVVNGIPFKTSVSDYEESDGWTLIVVCLSSKDGLCVGLKILRFPIVTEGRHYKFMGTLLQNCRVGESQRKTLG